jgi:hypothetical protein
MKSNKDICNRVRRAAFDEGMEPERQELVRRLSEIAQTYERRAAKHAPEQGLANIDESARTLAVDTLIAAPTPKSYQHDLTFCAQAGCVEVTDEALALAEARIENLRVDVDAIQRSIVVNAGDEGTVIMGAIAANPAATDDVLGDGALGESVRAVRAAMDQDVPAVVEPVEMRHTSAADDLAAPPASSQRRGTTGGPERNTPSRPYFPLT